MTTQSRGRGRPLRNCAWIEDRPFTLKEIASRMKNLGHGFSVQGLRTKALRDIASGSLEVVGNKESGGKGRPATLYQVAKA